MESLHRYAVVYDHQLSLAAPDSKTPVQVMKESFKFNPELFSQGLMIGRDVTLGRLQKNVAKMAGCKAQEAQQPVTHQTVGRGSGHRATQQIAHHRSSQKLFGGLLVVQ